MFEDLSPPHKPPFSGGLSPLPLPDMTPDEVTRDGAARRAGSDPQRRRPSCSKDANNVDDYAETLADTGLRFLLCERAWDRAGHSSVIPAPFEVDRALGDEHIATIERPSREVERQGRTAASPSACRPGRPTCARRSCCANCARCRRSSARGRPSTSTRSGARSRRSKEHRNRLPTEYLADLGFLNDRLICAHCRCMDAREENAARRGADAIVAFNACDRRAPRPEPARRRSAGIAAAISPWARTTWPRTWSR